MSTPPRPYFGGIPLGPEVVKLLSALGIPGPGLIMHERLEEITGLKRNQARYAAVMTSWKKRLLREHNVAAASERGVGVRILTEPERVDYALWHLMLNARAVMRNHRFALMTDATKLEEAARVRNEQVLSASAAMVSSAQIAQRGLVDALQPQQQLPRLREFKKG